jgi:hypothetical protein
LTVGAELIQIQEGEERAVAYGSLTLTPEQQKYCTTRKELLAIIRFSGQFRHYFYIGVISLFILELSPFLWSYLPFLYWSYLIGVLLTISPVAPVAP